MSSVGRTMDFLADIATSPKKAAAFVAFLAGAGLLGRAIINAQNSAYPHWKLWLELAGGFALGSTGVVWLYWLRASEKHVKNIDQIAVETLAQHAEIEHNAQKTSLPDVDTEHK